MQVDPIKPTLKPPGNKLLELKNGKPLSNFAFNFDLRRFTAVAHASGGGCARSRSARRPGAAAQVDPVKPALKAPGVKGLELKYDGPRFQFCFNFAFKFHLLRYILVRTCGQAAAGPALADIKVGRCRLTLSNPS